MRYRTAAVQCIDRDGVADKRPGGVIMSQLREESLGW